MQLSQTPGHYKEEGREKEIYPEETTKAYFQPAPPPQRPAEIRPMTRTEKAPKQKHTTAGAEHTQHQNTNEHDTTNTKGREERSDKRPAHEIAPDAVPCVSSSETSHT